MKNRPNPHLCILKANTDFRFPVGVFGKILILWLQNVGGVKEIKEGSIGKNGKASVGTRWMVALNLIVFRMLKARYFPNSDFMHATLGSIPYFVWSSILWGRDLLDANLYWCVGDGKMIDVYKDKWIPIPSTFKLYSPLL
ncbi:unnamed protein product [Prunus brigantina]